MRIEIFIDDESVPRQTLEPPATLELDTEGLADGPHRLRVHAIEGSGTVGVEEIPFTVRNGPGIAVVGLSDGDAVRGRIPLLVNAFARLPGVFPPLKDSAVVAAPDPSEHIRTVLRGLSGKTIGGVTYASAMPAFADQLTDDEVAAVLSHERNSWGNQAPPVKPEEVLARRH